ncbi:hypothetical protein J6X15_02415 [Candidatus Saccharibacteria bacterium]|nr:hypothetical protein [Candidatus Saccharibacteria bacterium]
MDNVKLIKDKKFYRDLLPVSEYVDDMIKYCEAQYAALRKKIDDDVAKNEQLNYSFQEFEHKESYSTKFQIQVYDAVQSFIYFDTYDAYHAATINKTYAAPKHVAVNLNLSYRSGKNDSLVDHKREFEVRFELNSSFFAYESNEEDAEFDTIKKTIETKLSQFPAIRTIFSIDEA